MVLRRILIGSLQIAGGQGINQFLSFTRNLIIARLIGPDDFGLALTFVLLVTLLEMGADLSCDKFIVQDTRGNEEDVQSTLHLFMAVRGILIAIGLFFAADLITRALHVPDNIAWTYQLLALAPLFTGFIHLDVKRYHRDLRYGPDVAAHFGGNVAGLVVGVALAYVLGDFRAMLYAIIVRFGTMTVISHLLAERRYRIGLSREAAERAWRFSWPLIINGLVLFAASQGDRALVVRYLGTEALGIYGAAALVTYALSTLAAAVFRNIGLPVLASKQQVRADYEAAYYRFGGITTLAAITLGVLFFVILPHLIPLIYGSRYDIPRLLIALLSAGVSMRIFRSWGIVGALALGNSRLVMTANILRTTGLGIAALVIAMGGDVVAVGGALLASEVIVTTAIFVQLRWRHALSLKRAALLFATLASVIGACLSLEWGAAAGPAASLGLYTPVLVVGLAVLFLGSAELRSLARSLRTAASAS